MKLLVTAALLVFAATLPAVSATPVITERIIVTGSKPVADAPLRDFIRTYTAPSPIGQVARWHASICPTTAGLSPGIDNFVTHRIVEVAQRVGIHVASDPHCAPNIRVVFTTDPQLFLNQIAKGADTVRLLGYHDVAKTKEIATFKYPIQAWYATATRGSNGEVTLDDACCYMTKVVHGGFIRTELSSEFAAVTVVADSNKIEGLEIGPVADYIAMLSLSQAQPFDACQEVASISNLFLQNCDPAVQVTAISDSDIAYLRGLYSMDAERKGQFERSDIFGTMRGLLKDQAAAGTKR